MMRRMEFFNTVILMAAVVLSVNGQTFSSGSNGSDGALNLTTPGTIVFDPKSFNPPLDPDGDGIYHFTTINIAAGVTVLLSARNVNGPLHWLATGAVQVDGNLDLSGERGHPCCTQPPNRYTAYPGPGGFVGGAGGRIGFANEAPAQPGGGPGGGAAGPATGSGGGGAPGSYTGNKFAIPLIGGSGGGGENLRSESAVGGGGGAGGGAILIASSTSIRVNGLFYAIGQNPGIGTGGSGGAGGAIRLVAPTITGSGTLDVGTNGGGQPGAIRIEAFQYSGSLRALPTANTTIASPSNLFLPSGPIPSLRISSIAGIPTPASPTGSFTVPDIAINTTAAVPIVVEARHIPVGTIVKLRIMSETFADLILDTTPLSGTTALSTATSSAIFPSGYSRGFVRATWTQ